MCSCRQKLVYNMPKCTAFGFCIFNIVIFKAFKFLDEVIRNDILVREEYIVSDAVMGRNTNL